MKYKTLTVCILLMALLTILFVSCSEGAANVTERASRETAGQVVTTAANVSSETDNALTSADNVNPIQTESPAVTAAPADFTDEPSLSEDGQVILLSDSSVRGPLVGISEKQVYAASGLKTVDELDKMEAKDIASYGLIRLYGNKSADYKVKTSKVFLRKEAFTALESMMASFKAQTGKTDVQIVSAYLYENEKSLESEFSAGYSIKMNSYDGSTYPLNYAKHKVSVGGTEMTYLEWFQKNCSEFGFIYTGLTGDENNSLANFRYVGTVHSVTITGQKLTVEEYTAKIRDGQISSVQDSNGNKWTVSYVKASTDRETVISVGQNAEYFISGTGEGGFIVAVQNAD